MARGGPLTVVPGYSGQLVSELFLESQLAEPTGSMTDTERRLAEWRRAARSFGPAAAVRGLFEGAAVPLLNVLGLNQTSGVRLEGNVLLARVGPDAASDSRDPAAPACPLTLVVVPYGQRLDRFWRIAVVDALAAGAPWAVLFNGVAIRIVDAGRLYARRFAEFDLDQAVESARGAAALGLLAHSAIGPGDRPGTTLLHALVADSDRHAAGVCRSLRVGVLSASTDVLVALAGRRARVPLADAFEQSLTIVYRLLFLLFAEARGLVPLWHPIYRQSYSVEALRAVAERPARAVGLWEALSAMARLAHAGCRAADLRVTAFNGRLFAPSGASLAERRGLDDDAARRAILALSTRIAPGGGRERISYRDLGVEQLGAVYETLLDYEPRADVRGPAAARRPGAVRLEPGSGVRKATGSFYTPQPIAEYLVRRTLGPLVRRASPDRILALRVVDPAMGSGAFLVAACRFLAAAYENALVESGACQHADVDEPARATMRRTVAERCLYGVDLNPMAVQLARLSLWLATLAADRPLTFLDHHLRVGDSLIGASIPHLSRPPVGRRARRGSDALPLFGEDDIRRAITTMLPVRLLLEETPDDTIEQVRSKERALADLNRRGAPLAEWKRVADAWCAPWFAQRDQPVPAAAFTAIADAILAGRGALPPATTEILIGRVSDIAARRRWFHWELEFPEVFFDRGGERSTECGFDAVLGNPPWDMIRADGSASREDVSAVLRFTRDAGLYSSQSDGHANRYQLFLERAIALTKRGGRLGLVLPSGLATDCGSAALRRRLLGECDVDALVGLDNREGVFPIHRSVKFLLLTASAGPATKVIACRFGERNPSTLASAEEPDAGGSTWFPVRVTPALLRKISGEALSIPDLRSPIDLAILERAASLFPGLGSPAGWKVRFGRELNATDDRGHLRAGGAGLPVVEGKQLRPFGVDLAAAALRIADGTAGRLLPARGFERPRLAYRDVASATNRRTLIAAVLPAGCVSTHTVSCLRTPLPLADQHLLCGLFNSLVVNYLVRLRVTTHVTTAVVEGLPVPRRDDAPRRCRRIEALARRLARRPDPSAAAEIDLIVAGLYQLSGRELEHVLSTFPLVPAADRETVWRRFTARS
ncbi:MAG: Eco57I restriction-modification methylase domain-containing protein [Betaproteobacteria bacterium]